MMGMRLTEYPSGNRQTGVIGLKEGANPLNLFLIGFFLGNLLGQVGQPDQIFLGGIGQKRKGRRCKLFNGVSLGPLIKLQQG